MNDPGNSGFVWFTGVVDDVNDPDQQGKVKIRVLSEHGQTVSKSELIWAFPVVPVTSDTTFGVGVAPVGITPGSLVVGYYLDGAKKTYPFVLGSWAVTGTADDGSDHGVSKQARGLAPVEKTYEPNEPQSQYKAEYPNNRVLTTRRGHVVEVDDTPGAERIHVYHASGSYIEMNADGTVVNKSAANEYNITAGDRLIQSKGDTDITTEGSLSLQAKKGIKVKAPGGITMTEGSLTVKGAIGSLAAATGAFSTPGGQTVTVVNGIITEIA